LSQSGIKENEKFVKEVQDLVDVYDARPDTGNEALDTILMEKGLYCRMHGINWTCIADGSLLNGMDVIDLYTLMGNALDNAVESVEQLDTARIIEVRIEPKNSFNMIQIENSCNPSLEISGTQISTTKKDSENHGFGLKSIQSIAEKYGGNMVINAKDGRFVLTVLLPNSGKS